MCCAVLCCVFFAIKCKFLLTYRRIFVVAIVNKKTLFWQFNEWNYRASFFWRIRQFSRRLPLSIRWREQIIFELTAFFACERFYINIPLPMRYKSLTFEGSLIKQFMPSKKTYFVWQSKKESNCWGIIDFWMIKMKTEIQSLEAEIGPAMTIMFPLQALQAKWKLLWNSQTRVRWSVLLSTSIFRWFFLVSTNIIFCVEILLWLFLSQEVNSQRNQFCYRKTQR